MFRKLKQSNKGFTIIEVLIVLAIAGLILLIVFLAVPALQRNSRNTRRNNDIASMIGAFNEYVNNSGGAIPTSNCTGATCAWLSNAKLGIYIPSATNFNYTYSASSAQTVADPTNVDNINMGNFSTCNSTGTASSTTNANSRSIAVVYDVESGGAIIQQCKTAQ